MKTRSILYSLQEACNALCLGVLRLLKTRKNYILLESEGDYTDNIKVFYDYLLAHKLNEAYKIIWIVHEPEKYKKEPNVVFISRFRRGIRWKCNYYAAVSGFFIFSHPYWLKKWKKDQIVINTTHSVAQLKKGGNPPPHKLFDHILCCSPYCREVKKTTFPIEGDQALILGMPRIDLMYRHKDCISPLVPDYHGERILLLMETFKKSRLWSDSANENTYGINLVRSEEELLQLDGYLKAHNTKLLIKIHHLQDLSFLKFVSLDSILYLTDDVLQPHGILVNELLENADILLTDYSSVFYEFLLTDKPIGFVIGDIEEYSRGFVTDDPLSEMPGEKIKTLDELFAFLENCEDGVDGYGEMRKAIREKAFTYEDDKNCERLYQWLQAQ